MASKLLIAALTGTVWAASAALAVFWLLQADIYQAGSGEHHATSVVMISAKAQAEQASAAQLSVLLGHAVLTGTAPDKANQFRLWGVASQQRGGTALLSIGNQPAKPYTVGSRLDEATFLLSVGPRHAVLGGAPGAPSQRLELSVE